MKLSKETAKEMLYKPCAARIFEEHVNEMFMRGRTEADEQLIPSCIFTDLEIAYVGLTEEQAKEKSSK